MEARPLLIRAHILPVRYRIIYKPVGQEAYLVYIQGMPPDLHGKAPDYITSLLYKVHDTRGDIDRDPDIENSQRRSSDHFLLQKPIYNYTKSGLAKRTFSCAAPDF